MSILGTSILIKVKDISDNSYAVHILQSIYFYEQVLKKKKKLRQILGLTEVREVQHN